MSRSTPPSKLSSKLVEAGAARDLLVARAALQLVVSGAPVDRPGRRSGELDLVAGVAGDHHEAGRDRGARHRGAAAASRPGADRRACVGDRVGRPARRDRQSVRLSGLALDAQLAADDTDGRGVRDLRNEQHRQHRPDRCPAPAKHDRHRWTTSESFQPMDKFLAGF
jgi:hypothetical protein